MASATTNKQAKAETAAPRIETAAIGEKHDRFAVVLIPLNGNERRKQRVAFSADSREDCHVYAATYLEHDTGYAVAIVQNGE